MCPHNLSAAFAFTADEQESPISQLNVVFGVDSIKQRQSPSSPFFRSPDVPGDPLVDVRAEKS